MKFVTYTLDNNSRPRFGYKKDDYIVDVIRSAIWNNENNQDPSFLEIPSTLKKTLENWDTHFSKLKELDLSLPAMNIQSHSGGGAPIAVLETDVQLLAPIPNPQSFRDFYAFEQHVRSARKLRGLEMHPDWFNIAIFYFSNPAALYGHGEGIPYPKGTEELDFELEFAVIIANGGSDISSEDADQYIAGYTIFNDGSIRDWQRHTTQFCPGKNFEGTGPLGPWMMTADEFGDPYAQTITTRLNHETVQHTAISAMDHKIDALIQYISTIHTIRPGDIISTGTPGGVGMHRKPPLWMKAGDVVSVEITGLGAIRNSVKSESSLG